MIAEQELDVRVSNSYDPNKYINKPRGMARFIKVGV